MMQANDRELLFSMVDGDFKKFEGKWSIKSGPSSATTTLSYEVNVIPRFNFPAIFLERIIRSDMPVNLRALACRAETTYEGNQKEISFEQVEGDFDSFQGKWILEQLGSHHTLLKYPVESKMLKNALLSEAIREEISRFQRSWGMDPSFMPSRKCFERAGRYDIARALEKWGGLHEVSRLLSLKAKLRAKEAKRAALEAKQKASKEAADREAAEVSKRISTGASKDEAPGRQMVGSSGTSNAQSKESGADAIEKSQSADGVRGRPKGKLTDEEDVEVDDGINSHRRRRCQQRAVSDALELDDGRLAMLTGTLRRVAGDVDWNSTTATKWPELDGNSITLELVGIGWYRAR
ncbi:hypothetical protein LWI28_022586 [Acer negundo]|uniref:Coenzyme Q-binding protein COQ10 START domain-containing protein n=1 Tax=Acer negundo TaxID=4023 RepID=A0AAD5NM49_ACENE|nr:hypothetical protein LWI28_022586 [Acer negundo]